MDMERRLEVESLTRELQVLEREEQELREKIDMIAIKKGDLLKRIADYSDEKYEQDCMSREGASNATKDREKTCLD